MQAHDFLLQMSTYYGVVCPPEQLDYSTRIVSLYASTTTMILEMDGGLGKTLGYLIPSLFQTIGHGRPIIIATSTIHNRNQIIEEFDRVQRFATHIGHPIATVPLINYRSVHDYCSIARIDVQLERLRQIGAPNLVISELADVRRKVQDVDAAVVEDYLPTPIMRPSMVHGEDQPQVFIAPEDISFALTDGCPPEIALDRCRRRIGGAWVGNATSLAEFREQSCVILVTHAMLAKHRTLRELVKSGEAAGVVLDETDRVLKLDFLSTIDISVAELTVIAQTLATDAVADKLLNGLNAAIRKVKSLFPYSDTVMLNMESMPDKLCISVFQEVRRLMEELKRLDAAYQTSSIDFGDLAAEFADRRFASRLDEMIGALDLFYEQFRPPYASENFRLQADSDVRPFIKWDNDGASLHIVSLSPGRSMKWLFAAPVPILLTTAFLAIEQRRFMMELGIANTPLHPDSGEIRVRRYGRMNFVYYAGLPNVIDYDAATRRYGVSLDYVTAVAQAVRRHFTPGSRMLILTPAYRDVAMLSAQLDDLPVLAFQHGSSMRQLSQELIAKTGILITVLWEGYNIVFDDPQVDGRRGALDTIVIERLPFSQPNDMVRTGLTSLYGSQAAYWLWRRRCDELVRTVYQGICRGVRGPNDHCQVLLMDARMPPPRALLKKNPLLQTKEKYQDLGKAIPARFANSGSNFIWKNSEK